MKKTNQLITLLSMLVVAFVVSGCGAKNVNISEFEEIDFELAMDTLEKYSDRFEEGGVGCMHEGYSRELNICGNQNINFEYQITTFSAPTIEQMLGEESIDKYYDEDGIDIRIVEEVHTIFEEQYILFEEFCSDNPDCIQMEMQDDRGYIIFDIDDSEIISALSGENEVSEGTRYYGVRYHCDRCYITATYMSDSNDDFRDFVSLLDELGLPHM